MSSSNRADGYANQEQAQQDQPAHGDAAKRQGHSGEGAASAFARMIQQDQKHRRDIGDAEQDAAPD